MARICSVEGCLRAVIAHDLCWKHYAQVRRHGRLTPDLERTLVPCKGHRCLAP